MSLLSESDYNDIVKYVVWTGDRTTDRILNIWDKWFSKKYKINFSDYDDSILDMLVNEPEGDTYAGLNYFVSFVLKEFPAMQDIGSTYDSEWAWNEFVSTPLGEKCQELLNDKVGDTSVLLDYIDNDVITENYDFDEELDIFFKENENGKKMKAADKRIMKNAFKEGGVVTFSNGKSFSTDEYVKSVVVDNKSTHKEDAANINTIKANYKNYAKNGEYVQEAFLYLPRLKDDDIHCLYTIDLNSIAELSF